MTQPVTSMSQQSSGSAISWTGFGLVGVCYGLIRFSYGQFLPQIRADLGMSEALAGVISSGIFFGTCLALLVAAAATDWFGPRAVAFFSGVLATAGLFLMSIAQTPLTFAISLTLAGISSGFSMPPLCAAVANTVRKSRQGRCAGIMNAGTGAGILISGPIAIYCAGAWREAFMGFAAISLFFAILVWIVTPARIDKAPQKNNSSGLSLLMGSEMRPLLISAILLGFTTSAIWTFGGEILRQNAGWATKDISLFWMIIGVAGLACLPAGYLVSRYGTEQVHRVCFLAMGGALQLMALGQINWAIGALIAVMFGAAYMVVTATYMVWGMRAMKGHEALAVAAAFFMLPFGQIAGSSLFGVLTGELGMSNTVMIYAMLCFAGMLLKERKPETISEPVVQTA